MRKYSIWILATLIAYGPVAEAQPIRVPATPNAVLTLPARKAPAPTPPIQDGVALPDNKFPDIKIRGIQIVGAEALSAADISARFAGLIGGTASGAELRAALQLVTRLYATAGFALGRAYIPAQDMKDGILTVRVLEGYVGAVVIETDTPRVKDTIARYAERILASRPLRTADLDRYLRLIAEIPGVTASAKLTDMNLETGKAALVLTVTYHPITTSLALDTGANLHSLPVQPYLIVKANDLIGSGDQFSLITLLSPVPRQEYFLQGSASTLIGSDGWRVISTTSIARARANVPTPGIDLSSTQLRSELQASYPLIKSAEEQVLLAGGVYFSQLRYDLNHFSIAKDRAFSAYGEVSASRTLSDKLSASLYGRATAGAALPYGAAVAGSRANAKRDFAKLNLNAALVYAATSKLSVLLRADGQGASGSLMAAEEVNYGGERFGRGYDSATVSGDHGFGFSVQPQYSFAVTTGWDATAFAFTDYARAFNTRGDLQGDATLLSSGVGVGLSHGSYSATLGIAQPFRKVAGYAERLAPRVFGSIQVKL